MKIGCIIYGVGAIHEALAECATKSFKKFHPGIDVHQITSENISTFKVAKEFEKKYGGEHGIFRWGVALEIWEKYEYDKIIMLGADTITCDRLDEFIDDNESDFIVTLDRCYQLFTGHIARDPKTGKRIKTHPPISVHTPVVSYREHGYDVLFDHIIRVKEHLLRPDPVSGKTKAIEYTHANADVVCFNNVNCLRAIHDFYWRYKEDWNFLRSAIDNGKFAEWYLAEPWNDDSSRVPPPDHMYAAYSGATEFYNEQGPLNLCVSLSVARAVVDTPDFQKFFEHAASTYGFDKLLGYKVGFAESLLAVPVKKDNFLAGALPPGIGNFKTYYNVRSKTTAASTKSMALMHSAGEPKVDPCLCTATRKFSVVDKKLYATDGEHIKMWHYGQGLGGSGFDVEEEINRFIFCHFNKETKKFFKEQCDCGDFFEKPFVI